MPDLSKFKLIDGKLYCWDKASEWLVEVSLTPLGFTPAAKKIVAAYIEDGSETAEKDSPV